MNVACIVYDGKNYPILECWESYTGWYWFILKRYPDTEDITFGYVVGFEKEFGDIDMLELKEQYKKGRCWPVPTANWFSVSYAKMIDPQKEKLETEIS